MPDPTPPTQDTIGDAYPEALLRSDPQQSSGTSWTTAAVATDGARKDIVLVTNPDGSLKEAMPQTNEVAWS